MKKIHFLTKFAALSATLFCFANSHAQDSGSAQEKVAAAFRPTLEELAATSDIIGIAQVYYTDYEYRHNYPVSGRAYMRMLITYRSDETINKFEVKEKGLHNGECYFPKTQYGTDGARFLVFLSHHPEGDYMGNPRLCMVPVAVTVDQGYAMPYPRPELNLTTAGEAAVTEVNFQDAHATIDASDMTRSMAARKAEELGGVVEDQKIVFNRGIPISVVRQLLGRENLKLPRSNR